MNHAQEKACNQAQPKTPLVVRIATEFVATALAMFIIYTFYSLATAMYGINILLIAVGTGVAYSAATSIAAKISGGHLNPAVTVASMLTGRTPYVAGIGYIVAQILGSLAAAGVFVFVLPQTKLVKDVNWFAPVVNGFEKASLSANQLKSVNASFGVITALVVEVIAVLLIVAVAMNRTDDNGNARCGYATNMGIAYAASTLITYQITGSGLNPARSTGIAVIASSRDLEVKPLSQLWAFWIAPIFAAALVGFVMLITKLLTDSAQNLAESNKTINAETVTTALPVTNEASAAVQPETNAYTFAEVFNNATENNLLA